MWIRKRLCAVDVIPWCLRCCFGILLFNTRVPIQALGKRLNHRRHAHNAGLQPGVRQPGSC
jgi:hypothetical protein